MKYLFLLIILNFSYIYSEKATFYGHAYEGSELLFKEEYIIERIDGKITHVETYFFSPSGEKIAQMSSSFEKANFLPKMNFLNKSSLFSYGTDLENDGISLFKKSSKGASKKKKLQSEANMVAGPGFYFFILDKLDNLLKGEKEHLVFIQPNRLSSYKFSIEAKSLKDQIIVTLKIDNPLLKKLVAPIELIIDAKSKALVTYTGLNGFLSEDNSLKCIKVSYSHPTMIE